MNESGNMSPFLYKKLKAWKGFKNWHKGTIVESALVQVSQSSSSSLFTSIYCELELSWDFTVANLPGEGGLWRNINQHCMSLVKKFFYGKEKYSLMTM